MNKSTLFAPAEPSTWKQWGPELLKRGGTVFLLGGVDTGKTSLARFIYGKGCQAGLRTAVLELDVGQSEFGPPTTATLFFNKNERKHYFIGRFSPQGAFWRCLTAASILKREAEKRGASLIVVDTTGLVEGSAGIWLKRTKIEILKPDLIIARERGTELGPILNRFSFREDIKIFRDPIPPQVRKFSPKERAILREKKFSQYFQGSKEHQLRADLLTFLPGPRFFEKSNGNGNLLVGLIDGEGWLISLGILLELGRMVRFVSPIDSPDRVKAIEAGSIRIFSWERLIIDKNEGTGEQL
ncbi:MAG: Clp1/GlmU family protein [Caldiserica bacterium]|jgi:polynucleotide 5'-hydroxyl-kinase GRC3/NOL9|nr:Clp1/GlmU family protein [Caldisericota bacterium]MDH7562878.1 Clp1/GlmU family protein [Caldisericota bacterium]